MRRERSRIRASLLPLIALVGSLCAAGGTAFGSSAHHTSLPPCRPEGYGLEARAIPRTDTAQDTVLLTAGWMSATERRRACLIETTVTLTVLGSSGVVATAQWPVRGRLDPWSSVEHTWAWQNWCSDTEGTATVEFSVPGGPTHSRVVDSPPACSSPGAASTVTDVGTGPQYANIPQDRIRPHILSKRVPPSVSGALITVQNGWLVSDGYTLVVVYAGSQANDHHRGLFVVVHQNEIFGVQYEPFDTVSTGKTGTLRIVKTRWGNDTSAQHGRLAFVSADGTRGVLELLGDRVRITHRR